MSVRSDMERSIGALLDGNLAGDDAVAYLERMDIGMLNAHQLAGAVDAVMARAVSFKEFPEAVDCCGTGGDGRSTYNISTATAIIVASRGVQVAKHGNRSVSSLSGSADVLEALGVNTNITPQQAAESLEKIGLAFLYAPTFHPSFAQVAPIRRAIGKRTIFNLLGPLCNPARVKRQLIGVFAPEYCSLMAETTKLLGHTHVMSIHGDDGTDELSVSGTTHSAILLDGEITYASIRPQDAGLPLSDGMKLQGGNAQQNARALRDVLEGIESPYLDAVLLNAAALLVTADRASTLESGVTLARSSIARGLATQKLDELIRFSNSDMDIHDE